MAGDPAFRPDGPGPAAGARSRSTGAPSASADASPRPAVGAAPADDRPGLDAGTPRGRTAPKPALPWTRQVATFFVMGALSAVVHYGLLVSLVEGYRLNPVPASLTGYLGGGVVSYLLNRRHTYRSDRPHRQATWRFAVVAAVGFGLTWGLMTVFVRGLGLPYLPAQLATTAVVLVWSFGANKLWTFRVPPIV